jgi:hypothetical protein
MGSYRGHVPDLLLVPASVSRPSPDPVVEKKGNPDAADVLVSLMLDTGAKYCSVTPEIIQQLGLPFLRPARVSTHIGQGAANLYVASLAFPASSLAALPTVIVAGLAMPPHLAGCHGVIGRDVLRRWETFYSGPRERLTVRDHRSVWGWLCS